MSEITELRLGAPADTSADFSTDPIFFVGTATVVLRYAGFTILTDPNFLHTGDHAHLGYGLTTERQTEPAMDIGDLTPLDFCVLSHYHGDHLDQVAEEKLQKDLPIGRVARRVTEPGVRSTAPYREHYLSESFQEDERGFLEQPDGQ